jgi:hypothetical protein
MPSDKHLLKLRTHRRIGRWQLLQSGGVVASSAMAAGSAFPARAYHQGETMARGGAAPAALVVDGLRVDGGQVVVRDQAPAANEQPLTGHTGTSRKATISGACL